MPTSVPTPCRPLAVLDHTRQPPSPTHLPAAQALTAAARCVASADSDSLRLLLRCADGALCCGAAEYADGVSNLSAWRADERWMGEPAVAGSLQQEQVRA